jgi:hypothetical protein
MTMKTKSQLTLSCLEFCLIHQDPHVAGDAHQLVNSAAGERLAQEFLNNEPSLRAEFRTAPQLAAYLRGEARAARRKRESAGLPALATCV